MKEPCTICGTEYEARIPRVQRDSHHTYTEYKPCPNCGYSFRIEDRIGRILKEEIEIKFLPGKPKEAITLNTEELENLILKTLVENWPKLEDK